MPRSSTSTSTSSKTHLLLDEAQLTPQHLTRMMEAFWNNNSIKSIVISQTKPKLDKFSKSLKHRVGKRVIKLAPLSPIKAHEMINLRTNNAHPFTDEALALLAEEAEYIPRKILEYCEISSIELGNKDKIDARDVRYVLDKHEENEADDELPDLDELELKEDALIPLESIDKIQGISPMEGRILKLLLEGGKTTHQLATILNTTIGSVGKQLSKLSKAEMPSWLGLELAKKSGKVLSEPTENDFEKVFDVKLIIEYYSSR